MSAVAVGFFTLGAVVLWGGLVLTLGITIYNEKRERA